MSHWVVLISLLISESAFQDTVIALEALAKFSNQINDVEDLDLRVELCVNDKRRENLHLNRQTALTQRAVEVRETSMSLFHLFYHYVFHVCINMQQVTVKEGVFFLCV